jgi:hypothetical protein
VGERGVAGHDRAVVAIADPAALGVVAVGVHDEEHGAFVAYVFFGVARPCRRLAQGRIDAHGALRRPSTSPAASITLRRYTHTLPGELERARDLLDEFLSERTVRRRASG